MGLRKWITRRGAVGSTARWAGSLYRSIRLKSPELPINSIMKELLEWRYRSERTQPAIDALTKLIDDNRIYGLAHLVANILTIEAGYQENSQETRFMFMEVIEEELRKLNIPEEDIFDYSRDPFE